jgi:hypothetical protein
MLVMSWLLWRRTRSIAFPFGLAVVYFWTHYGAWSIVMDLLGGDSQKHYHYLYQKMFPIYLDADYARSLVLYGVFMFVIALTALFWVRPARFRSDCSGCVLISHDKVVLICGFAAIASLWVVHDSLGSAIESGASGYAVTRAGTDMSWFRVHQVLNRIALVPAAIGFATFAASGGGRFLDGPRSMRHLVGYAAVLGFMFVFCVVLGNKNELAFALFTGSLFYLANSVHPRGIRMAAAGIVILACVGFIDFARGFAISDISDNISFNEIAYSLVRLANSNEGFAAHMSLYGAIAYELPLTYGSSLYSFVMSAIPRVMWPDRPNDIYWYYAVGVGANEGQGYSIHHATGWYLNFGVTGVVAGAFLWGRIWAGLYNLLTDCRTNATASPWRIFCSIGFFTFTACLPTLVRSGPEVYKTVLVESFLIPVVVLAFARSAAHRRIPNRAVCSTRASKLSPQNRRLSQSVN